MHKGVYIRLYCTLSLLKQVGLGGGGCMGIAGGA